MNDYERGREDGLRDYFADLETRRQASVLNKYIKEADIISPGLPQPQREAKARELISQEMARRVRVRYAKAAATKAARHGGESA